MKTNCLEVFLKVDEKRGSDTVETAINTPKRNVFLFDDLKCMQTNTQTLQASNLTKHPSQVLQKFVYPQEKAKFQVKVKIFDLSKIRESQLSHQSKASEIPTRISETAKNATSQQSNRIKEISKPKVAPKQPDRLPQKQLELDRLGELLFPAQKPITPQSFRQMENKISCMVRRKSIESKLAQKERQNLFDSRFKTVQPKFFFQNGAQSNSFETSETESVSKTQISNIQPQQEWIQGEFATTIGKEDDTLNIQDKKRNPQTQNQQYRTTQWLAKLEVMRLFPGKLKNNSEKQPDFGQTMAQEYLRQLRGNLEPIKQQFQTKEAHERAFQSRKLVLHPNSSRSNQIVFQNSFIRNLNHLATNRNIPHFTVKSEQLRTLRDQLARRCIHQETDSTPFKETLILGDRQEVSPELPETLCKNSIYGDIPRNSALSGVMKVAGKQNCSQFN